MAVSISYVLDNEGLTNQANVAKDLIIDKLARDGVIPLDDKEILQKRYAIIYIKPSKLSYLFAKLKGEVEDPEYRVVNLD